MRGLKLTFGEIHHVEHVGSEAETIAELLDAQGNSDNSHIGRLEDGKVDKSDTRQRHAGGHEPQRFSQTHLRCDNAADDAAT